MGIDLLDLTFRCEKEFGIKFDREELYGLIQNHPYNRGWFASGTHDICLADLVALIEQLTQRQNPERSGRIFERLKPLVCECLGVRESEVKPDSWLAADLGME